MTILFLPSEGKSLIHVPEDSLVQRVVGIAAGTDSKTKTKVRKENQEQKEQMKTIITALFGTLAAVSLSQAQPTLVNGNFETAPAPTKTWYMDWNGSAGTGVIINGTIPGWNMANEADAFAHGNNGFGDSGIESSGGSFTTFLDSKDPAIYQTTSYLIGAGDPGFTVSFTMSGNWAGWNHTADPLDVGPYNIETTLYYDLGGVRTPFGSGIINTTEGSPMTTYSLTVSSVPGAAVGNAIGIQFDNITDTLHPLVANNNGWVNIDNVTLSLVPEPATVSLLGLGALVSLMVLRRRRA